MNHTLTPEVRAQGLAVRQRNASDNAEAVRWVMEPLVQASLSLSEIASVLNERRIRAPRGNRWYPESVRRVLKILDLYETPDSIALRNVLLDASE